MTDALGLPVVAKLYVKRGVRRAVLNMRTPGEPLVRLCDAEAAIVAAIAADRTLRGCHQLAQPTPHQCRWPACACASLVCRPSGMTSKV